MQAFSIQIDALKQLYQFFYGNQKVKLKRNKVNVADIRNDIVHSSNKIGKESCFIAKSNNMDIGSLNYGIYGEDNSFTENNINLRDICLTQVQSICDAMKDFMSVPNDQIFFIKNL